MAKKVVTNDGKKGGWLIGKRHYDKNGKPLGGIKAVVTDAGNKPVELEGGEVIINREASKKYWKELSKINQSAGNGVAIEPPSDAFDEDPNEDYENGGKIEFNANHIPNKWILNYAIKIKEEHPEIWKLGGNIFGNQAFINLKRVAERGHWLDSEEWMYKKWRSYVARHQRDYRIEGVVAMLKWVDKVEKGWQYMKNLIEEEIKKREARNSKKMKDGGNVGRTPAPLSERIKGSKFNASGSAKDSTSGEDIKFDDKTIASIQSLIDSHNEKYPSKKITLAVAKAVVRRGMGAYSSSHRPTITGGKPNSRTAWGLARLKAFIHKAEKGKSKSGKYSQDNDLFDDLDIKVSKFATGGLIAPNGKHSNLTPEQYKLVRTKAFKDWFGDWENSPETASKVVDDNGEPLVCYHGSPNEFSEYKYGFLGFWFSPIKKLASSFSKNDNLHEVFLNIKEPKKYNSTKQEKYDPYERFRIDIYSIEGLGEDVANKYGIADWDLEKPKETKQKYIQGLMQKNYDGIFIENTKADNFYSDVERSNQIIAFEPNQIKLADGSNTTFDGNNPDIRFSHGGSIELEKGIKAEYEHAKTIAQFKREGVSVRDVARSIAEDHIKEDPHYYSKLEKMEGKKFATGGIVENGISINIGDTGLYGRSKDQITITGITTKLVNFTTSDGKKKGIYIDSFAKNYIPDNPSNYVQSGSNKSTSPQTSGEWRVKTLKELISEGLFRNSEYRGIGAFIINQWGGNNVEEIDKNVISNLNSGKTNFSFDGFNVGIGLFTKDPLPTTQSKVVHELNNYRIKTEQELLKEFGKNFRSEAGFSTNKSMDWLFGKKITEIVLPSDYDDVLQKVKNNKRFSSDPSFDTDKTSWNIFDDMYMFEPALYSQNVATNLGQKQQKDLRPSSDSNVWDAAFKVGDVVYIRKDIADFVGIDFDSDDNVFKIITEKFKGTVKSPKNKTGTLYKIEQVKNIANKRTFNLEGKDIALIDSNQTNKQEFGNYILKKNVTRDDFKNTKIIVDTPEKSEAFQKLMFELDIDWSDGQKKLNNTDKIYLFVDNNFYTEQTLGNVSNNNIGKEYYENSTNKELNFNDIFELKWQTKQDIYELKKSIFATDLFNTKIIVDTPEKSEAFQNIAFELGIGWGTDNIKSLQNLDKRYLYIRESSVNQKQILGYTANTDIGRAYYENSPLKEIKFDDLFKLKGQSKPVLSDESLEELFKDVKEIDKEREEIEVTPQKNEKQINDELKALEDEYNDLLFLIDSTPSTDIDNMLALKKQAKELKDKIDLLHLDLKKKVTGELELLDNLFNASSVQPQERYKFNAYNDGFAPDGQPTSLPKNLYDWTMTEEFQNWFGNFTNAYNYRNSSYENVPCSVVVNKNYEPLVVYHGTGVQFSFFKFDKFPAMYFAENEAYSNWFAEMKGQQVGTNGYVYPFFLNIRTPLDLTIYGIDPVSPGDFIDWMFLQTGLDADELKISKALLDPTQKFQAWMYLRNSPEMLNVLRDKAICDGIIYYEDNPSVEKSSDAYQTKAYIVFNSNSAKIADPNREMMTIPAMRSFYLKRGGKL